MSEDKLLKMRVELSDILLKEATPYMTGQPRVWARQFGDQVTFGETYKKMAMASLPFSKTGVRHDVLVFHDIPTEEGILHVVQPYSGSGLMPTDFMITIPYNIPRAVWAKQEFVGSSWTTELVEVKQPDSLKDLLENTRESEKWDAKRLIDIGLQWEYPRGRVSIKLPYTIQLIPNGKGETLVQLRKVFKAGFFSVKDMKFLVGDFLAFVKWLKSALDKFDLPKEPTTMKIPVANEFLLAVPEFAHLFGDTGAEMDWPELPQYFASGAQTPQPQSPPAKAAATEQSMFCVNCGEKLPGKVKFCPKCGGQQP
jgi:hypothetical protein